MAIPPLFRPARPGWSLPVALAVALLPVALVRIPPLVDYPNHLARAVVLVRGAASHLTEAYDIAWRNVPNLGTDVLLMGLVQLLPPAEAGRLFIALVLATLTAGVAVHARVAFGRWTWWSALGCGAALNGTLLFGFLSFNLACGEALLLAAAWRALRPVRPVLAALVLALGTVLVWFTHLGGLMFAVLLCGAAEVSEVLQPGSARERVRRALERAGPILPALAVIAVLVATSSFTSAPGAAFQSLATKPFQFYLAFASYDARWDIPAVVLPVLVLGLCAARGRLAVDKPSLLALGLCIAAFCVSPMGAKGANWIATRFAVMTSLLLYAGFAPRPLGRALVAAMALAVLAVGVRVAGIASVWTVADREFAEVRSLLACVQPGARIAVYGWPMEGPEPALPRLTGATRSLDGHIGAWAVTDRDAIWTNLFALEGQQPLRLKQDLQPLVQPTFVVQPLGTVAEPAADGRFRLGALGRRFDVILLIHAAGATVPPVEGLSAVAGAGPARLFSVEGRGVDRDCAAARP